MDISQHIHSLSSEKRAELERRARERGLKLILDNVLSVKPRDVATPAAIAVTNESIAIIGLGCRFPQAADIEAYWELLHQGRDAITRVPGDRWDADAYYDPDPATPGKMNTQWGGFVEQLDGFDCTFFKTTPYEAERMDPQQRLLLEVAWEALEHAGQASAALHTSQTGVFIGISTSDYARRQLTDPMLIDGYSGAGNSHCIAANRLSYLFDLRGPSLAVDTACSSSLVALHLACQSLRNHECNMALGGGVNALLSPCTTIIFSQARMMAPDGRCKTFDARANGYVRGEGAGMVVLKRLSDAQRDGDNILAVIRGSAVNQDGLSNGLTAPNGIAQQAVIRAALRNAGVAPAEISYVEAHGTGTPLGDPIEVLALAEVLKEGRDPDARCLIGSVKTNIGHTEAAAGIAGLIKVVLALQHEEIPPHLHFTAINPVIPLDQLPLEIATEARSWTAGERVRYAGVSSFGFGGTNAHIILQEAPSPPVPSPDERGVHLLLLSAHSASALAQLAQRYRDHLLHHPDEALADLTHSANTGRAAFTERLALRVTDRDSLRAQLETAARGDLPAHAWRASAGTPPRVAFLFTGQGAQYPGMGQPLYTHEPVFRDTLDACADHLAPLLPGDLRAHLYPQPGQPDRLHETWLTQPALFAVEYALARLWQSWGITPAAVLGHSVGEYVAACVAGVFSLEDALTLIATRARLMNELPRGGAMAAVRLSETDLRTRLAAYGDALTLAALNGPQHYTVSGDEAALTDLVARLTADQIGVQRLSVSHAFHSAHMQPMVAAYRDVLRRITFAPPCLPLIANVTGLPLGPNELNADYWIQHLLKPVRFADSLRYLHQDGIRTYLEVGPKATLLGLARATLPPDSLLLATLQPPETPWHSLYDSLAQLYVRGAPVDTRALDRGRTRRKLPLPTYPFERQRCWFETAADRADPTPETQTPMNATLSPSTLTTHHPLLDTAPAQRDGSHHLYAIRLTADQPVVRDHRVQGNAILPGVAYLELALAAAERHSQHPHTQLNHLLLTAPLAAEADGSCQARVRLLPNDAGGLGFVV
ncbi:MAG: type I polyketide synthase, partial [Gammaproteobacteria bacterium]